MMYKVEYTPRALKDLKKLDKQTRALILGWIEKNLVDCENPRLHGKSMTGNLKGKWRYRVGDYRILSVIEDDKILIMVLSVGHRSEIYDR